MGKHDNIFNVYSSEDIEQGFALVCACEYLIIALSYTRKLLLTDIEIYSL